MFFRFLFAFFFFFARLVFSYIFVLGDMFFIFIFKIFVYENMLDIYFSGLEIVGGNIVSLAFIYAWFVVVVLCIYC